MVFSPLSYFFSVVLFVIFTGHTSFATKSRLVIGGLAGIKVDGQGWSSKGVVPAVELALERVNKHSDILKDYHLGIEWKDSKVCQNIEMNYIIAVFHKRQACVLMVNDLFS